VILLVEDNKIDQIVTRKIIIQLFNEEPVILNNGQEAIQWFYKANLSQKIYLLLDIKMPIMTGLEFLQAFHTEFKNVNLNLIVFMLTSSIDENDYKEAMKFTCVKEFISKPLKPTILQEAILKY
jgi:CheY-like chemotaxis protein